MNLETESDFSQFLVFRHGKLSVRGIPYHLQFVASDVNTGTNQHATNAKQQENL